MKKLIALFTSIALVLAAIPLFSYITDRSKGSLARERWTPGYQVKWNLNPAKGAKITGSRSLADVIQASFNTWTGAPNIALNVVRGSDSSVTATSFDDANVICFVCQGDFSKEPSTLAVTTVTTTSGAGLDNKKGGITQGAGEIVDADILFNPNVNFSTDAASGDTVHDLQTVATHEIGHFFGLGHSAVVRAVMFPFSPDSERTLSYDDVAGMSIIYPKGTVPTGSIAGAVKLNGGAVFGAHVFADSVTASDAFGGAVRKSAIGSMTAPDGTYTIEGVPADSYTVGAEPLDLPVTNTDVNSGFTDAYGQSSVQTNFTTRWH